MTALFAVMLSRFTGYLLLVIAASAVACSHDARPPITPNTDPPAADATSSSAHDDHDEDDDGRDVNGHGFVGPGASGTTGPSDAH